MIPKIVYFLPLLFFYMSCTSSAEDKAKAESAAGSERAKGSITVIVDTARIAPLERFVRTGGTSSARRVLSVSLEQSGYISRIPETEGKAVPAGGVLLALDNEKQKLEALGARTALIKALAAFGVEYENPDSALARLQKAHISDAAPLSIRDMAQVLKGGRQSEVRMAQSGLSEAWNTYRRALLAYQRTVFKAPFSGLLADIAYKKGQWLPAATEALKLLDVSEIRLQCDVLEKEAPLIAPGQNAEVVFPSLPQKTFRARVFAVNPSVDAETHTVRVTLTLDNPGTLIRPGMYARARIAVETLRDRLVVPRRALVLRDNRELVFVVRDSLAQWCYVQTGARNDRLVEIVSSEFNLQPGEPVVVEGHFSLAHNARVNPRAVFRGK